MCRTLRSELTFGDPNGFLCLYVGRISKEKRMDVLVDAIKDLPGVYLAIIGTNRRPTTAVASHFAVLRTGDGPSAHTYAAMHGKANRIYCKPRFLSHSELAEVSNFLIDILADLTCCVGNVLGTVLCVE
jgi:glycosyltransferase involved in cell wall biosynthesis